MKKLKSIDFKALFIEHGEKMGLGLIGFIVLLVLGMGTAWSTCSQSPGELTTKIDQAKASIDAPTNTWPKAKSDQFVVVDFTDKARDLFKGVETAKYEFSTPMYWPLYRKKEKSREPEFLAVQYLIADPGEALLVISAAPVTSESLASNEGEMAKAAEASSDEYKPAAGAPLPGKGPAGNPFPGASHAGPGGAGKGPMANMTPEMYGKGMSGSAVATGGGDAVAARGFRYVAVRGIIPIKEQTEKAMRALNLSSVTDASAAIEYTDFVLERQAAIAGPDPWAGRWEPVSIATAEEVIKECSDLDEDPVPGALQDSAITMGLPKRLLKYWGDHATHPNIKNFQLSKEEMERENKLQAKLVEEFEKLQLENAPKVEKKGLNRVQNDLRGMGNKMRSNTEGSAVMKSIAGYMNEGGGKMMAPPDIQDRLTAIGRYYLFRFFDFDVQPGMAYRYRVKLELRNPNFERPYEEVENPDFTRDPYRWTGWSNISSVAVVPESIHYYLKEVERDPLLEDKPTRKPIADVAMFEWDSKIGTMLAAAHRVTSIGQSIGEPNKKTWVLDPAAGTFEEKPPRGAKDPPAFATEDVLLDARADLELPPDLHPDLGLKSEKNRKEVKIGMLPEALVVTSLGQLKELDPVSESDEELALRKRVEAEQRNYEYLKNATKETDSSDKDSVFKRLMGDSGTPKAAHGGGAAGKKEKSGRKKKTTNSAAGGMSSLAPPSGVNMPNSKKSKK